LKSQCDLDDPILAKDNHRNGLAEQISPIMGTIIWAEAALKRGDRVAATARDLKSLSPLAAEYGDSVLPLQPARKVAAGHAERRT
jgi:hypothetical protein